MKHFNRRSVVKKVIAGILATTLILGIIPGYSKEETEPVVYAQNLYSRQVESLNRGLTAVKTSDGVFLSWRLLGTEAYETAFNVYKDGVKIAGPITNRTNFVDTSGSISSTYYVRTIVNGSEKTQSDTVTVWANQYKDVPIKKPANTTLNGVAVTYSANDATVADVDGDGEYEIILKWDPSNAQDNANAGYTSNVYVDCYELNGTLRWRIDLGKNIRAGAHYTQIIAYDLNGDGKAEVAMKTADGTIAGDGTVIGNANADYRNSSGYILSGPEYLTLFDGRTGAILDNIDFTPARGTVSSWGDNYGNRVDRFLSGVAYLDGKTPSLIIARGYYTRSVVSAYKYRGGTLNRQWTFDTNSSGNSAYAGQGNHSLSIADVDEDGYDEIVYGSLVIDHTGKALYSTGQGHGDALHVGDFDPTHSGLEIYQVHETKSTSINGVEMRDAKTGSVLMAKQPGTDVGRGLVVNIDPDYYPYVALSSAGSFDKYGNQITNNITKLSANFASWWDGDLYREILDSTYINKWNYTNKTVDRLLTGSNVHQNNGTKATPSLSGDILGDWREEVIWPLSDDSALRIYTTTIPTNTKLYTLMHDTQYREAIAWQNVAYNQPPHPSYYIGPDMATPVQPNIYTCGNYAEQTVTTSTSSPLSDGGIYYIKNKHSGKYLDVDGNSNSNGANVYQWTGNGDSGQKFKLVSQGNGYYSLLPQCGNYQLAVDIANGSSADGTNAQLWGYTANFAQQFYFQSNSDGTYAMLTKASNNASALEVYEFSTADGGNVCQYAYWGGDAQHWYLELIEDPGVYITNNGIYELKNVNSGLYLDVFNGLNVNGTNVQQWTGNGATAQQFKMAARGNGYYSLLSASSNFTKALDIDSGKTEDGTNVIIWDYHGGDPQQFYLKRNLDGSFALLTKGTNNASAIEVYNFSTVDGGNVCQYGYWGGTAQHWYLEPVN